MSFSTPEISACQKGTQRSRGSREVKKVPKVRKVAKIKAYRIREYRTRKRALENAASAGLAFAFGGSVNYYYANAV